MKTTARFSRWLAALALGLTVLAARAGEPARTGHREGIERRRDPVASTHPEPPWHGVFMPRWPGMPTFHWYQKLNPVWWLGNAEEPDPPAWYEPGNPHRHRDWYWRNPFTNFSNFVIGVADKDTMRYGRYPAVVGNPHGGWNFAITRRRLVCLPFWDYKNSRMEFYLGWRERGNFGIKLNFHHTPEKIAP